MLLFGSPKISAASVLAYCTTASLLPCHCATVAVRGSSVVVSAQRAKWLALAASGHRLLYLWQYCRTSDEFDVLQFCFERREDKAG